MILNLILCIYFNRRHSSVCLDDPSLQLQKDLYKLLVLCISFDAFYVLEPDGYHLYTLIIESVHQYVDH